MFVSVQTQSVSLRSPSSQISQSDWDVLAAQWYPVAVARDIGETPFATKLLDVDLVLFRSDDGIAVLHDRCPHRWVRLSAGTVANGNITCAFHGLTFSGEGRCVHVPALGRTSKLPPMYRTTAFRSIERYGMVWVCLDDDSTATAPTFDWLEPYDGSAIAFIMVWEWPMSAARQIENFFDLAHLPFIHATTLGGDQNGRLQPPRIEERDDHLIFRAEFLETVPFEQPTNCHLTYRVHPPFTIDFESRPEGGEGFRTMNIASPMTAHTCRVFQFMPAGQPGEVFDTPPVLPFPMPDDGPGTINQQDIDILQHLSIHDMPLTEKLEIHLPVDNVSAAYRRRLRDMGLGQA